ncbi:MAG: molybdenum cofactor biosynthesis protein MoaE [Candidatus Latescibacteria bacterium]|nr:molybdenum cofactor biosynthesis protein MoaE [Candidatus Latescibacterota bacterium]
MFKITEARIESDELYRQVLQDQNGAVVTFCGVVRNHANNKPTRYLVYEAYPEMAEKKMAEIGAQIEAKWKIQDLGMVHRVGRLEIGEISVLIAVSSPHRAEAFEACRYAIDRLKEIVPIWKKEVGEDGEEWVEGPGMVAQKG